MICEAHAVDCCDDCHRALAWVAEGFETSTNHSVISRQEGRQVAVQARRLAEAMAPPRALAAALPPPSPAPQAASRVASLFGPRR